MLRTTFLADYTSRRRRILAKVYELLIRLADEKQTTFPDDFGEKTGWGDDIALTSVRAIDSKLFTLTPGGQNGGFNNE